MYIKTQGTGKMKRSKINTLTALEMNADQIVICNPNSPKSLLSFLQKKFVPLKVRLKYQLLLGFSKVSLMFGS